MIGLPQLCKRFAFSICWLALLLAVVAAAASGPTPLHLDDELGRSILFDIRLPRIAVGALCGLALAMAGTLCQGLFRNPLATPSVIGTEAAAATAAALVYYWGIGRWLWFAMPAAACAGAIVATLLVLRVARSRHAYAAGLAAENLLLVGFSLTMFLGAFTSLIISLAVEAHQQQGGLLFWLFGDLNARGWEHLWLGLPAIAIGGALAWRGAYQLNVLALGDDVARSLQVKVEHLRQLIIVAVALLVGGSVAMAGTIPFVGFIVPHITRRVFGAEHKRLLLLSAINGMTLVVSADLFARTVRSPYELQVGIVIALVSAPLFAWLLLNEQREPRP